MCCKFHSNHKRGFTLVELLITIAVVGILTGVLAPALSRTRNRVKISVCQNNLKMMITSALMYSTDDSRGSYSDSLSDSEDNFNCYIPYLNDSRSYVCPGTRNRVNMNVYKYDQNRGASGIYDINHYAGTTHDSGTSYELFGYFANRSQDSEYTAVSVSGGRELIAKGVRKTTTTVTAHPRRGNLDGLYGVPQSVSQIWLALDGDEPPGNQNYPDEDNNHGISGGNISFCDGHVGWVRRQEYRHAYELSQDEK